MKTIPLTLLFFVLSAIISFGVGRDFEFAIIILGTILGFVTAKVFELQKDLKSLRETFANDWKERQSSGHQTAEQKPLQPESDSQESTDYESKTEISSKLEFESQLEQVISVPLQNEESLASTSTVNKPSFPNQYSYKPVPVQEDTLADKATEFIKSYFTGGNLFVRIGIIILFFGVSFLLKYVSDRGLFPIEYRLIGVVLGAVFLLVLGWRLRHKNLTYALLLQGAGVGILYLDIYAAFSLYHLLPVLPAFALLFVVSMLSAALAVLQDSKSLAILGFSGGFLAPVLASSGSNNHIALFSYYAVLNVAIVVIAWFKAWRSLNLLGFAFTFIIGTAWGVFSYADEKFSTTEPFLILFFLFYVLIAVFFALRQPQERTPQGLKSQEHKPQKIGGYVDGTLLFGVPLAASALQYSLVKNFEYGISFSAFAMGAFYLALAWFIWKRKGDHLKLLSEAFLALGVIFTSMAIPFALAPTQTAAAWAVEGLGLIWLGSLQNRLSVRVFGLLLQLGAAFFVLMRHDFLQDVAFLNGTFISAMMMTVAGILSARLLNKLFEGRKSWEEGTSPFLLVWGLTWLFGSFSHQIATHYGEQWLSSSLLILAALCSFGFTLLAQRLKPEWKQAWYAASGLLAVMLLVALFESLSLFTHQNYSSGLSSYSYHPLQLNGWIAWPLAFASFYYLLKILQQNQVLRRFQAGFHTLSMLLLVVLITLEGHYRLVPNLPIETDWSMVWFAVPATLFLWLITKAGFWPFKLDAIYDDDKQRLEVEHQFNGHQLTGLALSAFLMLWGFQALVSQGNPAPLPWIPLLNPLDITLGIVLLTLVKWWKTISPTMGEYSSQNKFFNKRVALSSFGVLIFLWLNFTLFRVAHHWFDVPYASYALYHSSLVQTAVSILWAITGVLITVYSSRKDSRGLWIAGGVLLVLVVLKLFVIDLSALGSLARIISFLVVGALLTSIGYFAPLPDKAELNEEANTNEESQNA